jgi:hypothetical protein
MQFTLRRKFVKDKGVEDISVAAEVQGMVERLLHIYRDLLGHPLPMLWTFEASPLALVFAKIGVREAVQGRFEQARRKFAVALRLQEIRELQSIKCELRRSKKLFAKKADQDQQFAQRLQFLRMLLARGYALPAMNLYLELWLELHSEYDFLWYAFGQNQKQSFRDSLKDLADLLGLEVFISYTHFT